MFQATEAYLIEGGKVTAPVKGAMLIGNGPEAMQRVTAVGDDLALDHGTGTCGKNGQGVPVGVGQPTVRMERMTVGGTARTYRSVEFRLHLLGQRTPVAAQNGALHCVKGVAGHAATVEMAQRAPRGRSTDADPPRCGRRSRPDARP